MFFGHWLLPASVSLNVRTFLADAKFMSNKTFFGWLTSVDSLVIGAWSLILFGLVIVFWLLVIVRHRRFCQNSCELTLFQKRRTLLMRLPKLRTLKKLTVRNAIRSYFQCVFCKTCVSAKSRQYQRTLRALDIATERSGNSSEDGADNLL